MSEISLEWFFQIPGLFITIGVLLILVALLVLIIGSSKARSKKEVMDSEEQSNVEPVVSSSEAVNVIGTANDTVDVENVNLSDNSVSQVNANNVNLTAEPIVVSNSDNIMPIGEATPSIVTPLNINESLEIPTVESADEQVVDTVIPEPIIKKNEELVQDNLVDVNEEIVSTPVMVNPNLSSETLIEPVTIDELGVNSGSMIGNNEVKPLESTMAPVFSEPDSNMPVLENPTELTPIEPILKSSENNTNTVIGNVVEPIISLEPKVEVNVPNGGNTVNGTTMMPIVENTTSIDASTENTEIEEIL